MDSRRALAVVAGVVLALGVFLAVVPTSASGVDCGSALAPDTSSAAGAEFGDALKDVYRGGDGSEDGGYVALCEDRISTQRLIAFTVAGVGGLALLFMLLTSSSSKETADPSREA